MPIPRQYTLAIDQPHEQRLDNFVPGLNKELLGLLQHPAAGFQGFWIYGDLGSGRSHLLRGACLRAQSLGHAVSYVGCEDYHGLNQNLVDALDLAGRRGSLVAIDDFNVLVGERELEALVLGIYQRLLNDRGTLLVSHNQTAHALSFVTQDLASRMRSLQHFQIRTLDDVDKVQLLRLRAQERGYDLAPAVLDYWLARGPRDLGALLTDLDSLDKASLAQHQKVTIPLLKQVLGY